MRLFLVAFTLVLFSGSLAAQTYKETAVDDPAKNYYLERTLVQEADPAAEALRVYVVFQTVWAVCNRVQVNPEAARRLNVTISRRLAPIKDSEDINEIRFKVRQRMHGFDAHNGIHLCAGVMTLFGPNGRLWPGLITASDGLFRPKSDPRNPYLTIPIP